MTAEYISQSDFQDNDFLNKRCTRKVYLVTYSQVDEEKCSDREPSRYATSRGSPLKFR